MLIVSVSGIRGLVGNGLAAADAVAFAAAVGTFTNGGRVVLSRDGRPTGDMLRHAVIAGLLQCGCEIHDLGVAPTPTCGLAVQRLCAASAIQITASHNPAEWNGLKIFNTSGAVLTPVEGTQLKQLYDTQAFHLKNWNEMGRLIDCRNAEDWHRDRVLELVDATRIRERSFGVFLDANGGAGGPLGQRLLRSFGCRVASQGCSADGVFIHPPEPTAENLTTVLPLIPQVGADLGCVLDPDSDRLAIIDETGRYIGEELTLALAVLFRLGQERGPVVVNMSTSRIVEDLAQRFGVPFHRSAVGEANVTAMMREVGAVIGGEGNGGVIDPRVGFVRDPFIGIGLILNLLAESGKKLSEVVADLPTYHIVKDKYTLAGDRLPLINDRVQKHWPEARVNRVDGLRLDWQDRWLHIRSSNTEPIVRVIAEAPRQEDAQSLCRQVGRLIDR